MSADSSIQHLFAAIRSSDLAQVQQLLTSGLSPNCHNDTRQTPIGLAAQLGNAAIVQALLDAGANLDAETIPLSGAAASQAGFEQMLQAALSTRPEETSSPYGSPLYQAASQGHAQIVSQLLAAGAAVDRPNATGHTPLMAAAARGDLETVKRLVAAGADVDAWADGVTPLLNAARSGKPEVYDFLAPLVATDIQRYTQRELATDSLYQG